MHLVEESGVVLQQEVGLVFGARQDVGEDPGQDLDAARLFVGGLGLLEVLQHEGHELLVLYDDLDAPVRAGGHVAQNLHSMHFPSDIVEAEDAQGHPVYSVAPVKPVAGDLDQTAAQVLKCLIVIYGEHQQPGDDGQVEVQDIVYLLLVLEHFVQVPEQVAQHPAYFLLVPLALLHKILQVIGEKSPQSARCKVPHFDLQAVLAHQVADQLQVAFHQFGQARQLQHKLGEVDDAHGDQLLHPALVVHGQVREHPQTLVHDLDYQGLGLPSGPLAGYAAAQVEDVQVQAVGHDGLDVHVKVVDAEGVSDLPQ